MAGLMNPGLKSPEESGAFFRWTEVQLPPAEARGSHRNASRCSHEDASGVPPKRKGTPAEVQESSLPIGGDLRVNERLRRRLSEIGEQ
jgi:hypothetical protein